MGGVAASPGNPQAAIHPWLAIVLSLALPGLWSPWAFGDEALPNDEHHPAHVDSAEAARQVSELTERVAGELPDVSPEGVPVAPRTLIDRHLFAAMARDGVPCAPLADDYEFVRRIHLDLTGRLPTADATASFVADTAADKRDRLIDELIDSQAWVDHWAYWFGDQFRNCANRIGNASTKHFDQWLRRSLKDGKPYDQFVTELFTASAPNSGWMPDAAPAAFLSRWHISGESMYSDRYEDTADEIIVQSARIFLGLNLQCISCHGGSGFLEKVDLGLVPKERSDFWAMSAFFGNMRVRIVPYQDRFTITEDGTGYDTTADSSVRLVREGGDVAPTFLLTGERANQELPLRPQFARMLTEHPQFARATVNLIWKQFFGLGIVEPVDAFDLARQDPSAPPPSPWIVQPTNAELLDELASHFAEHGFNLKDLMRTIARSQAYRLSSRYNGEWHASYTPYFARHFVRLLTAEQLHDAIVQATDVYGNYSRRDLLYGSRLPPIRYWTEAATPENIGDGEAKQFLRTFGQTNREWAAPPQGGSILQAMMLMNNRFVTKRVRAARDSRVDQLVRSDKDAAAIVDEMYMHSLCRLPSAEEKDVARAWIEEDRREGAEDLQWCLLNKLDFLFNY